MIRGGGGSVFGAPWQAVREASADAATAKSLRTFKLPAMVRLGRRMRPAYGDPA